MAATAGFTFLNPHVYLDTVLLMGAAGSAQPADLRPLFIAGAVSASFAWFAALGYGARMLAPLFARPAAGRALDALVGVTMLTLAASLAVRAIAAGLCAQSQPRDLKNQNDRTAEATIRPSAKG